MGTGRGAGPEGLRDLPAVHELAAELEAPHALSVAAARRAIDERRAAILDGAPVETAGLTERASELLAELVAPSLRPVLNGTGVILHTNLGRAPLASAARAAVSRVAAGYSNLEFDLETGARGSRHGHVEELLRELTGARSAMVVNNGAAAVLLAVAALAGPQTGVVVSRGQLVEIGGGFRIPDVVAQSGARLIEVGTTNRTRLEDYRQALAQPLPERGAILRVHPSNFRTIGFVEQPAIEDLCAIGVPVIDDLGSGVLTEAVGIPALADEPAVASSVAAGATLICCSADKLLGGPQAGLIFGLPEAVAAARAHPLARAMRIDKLSIAALEATLVLYRDPARARREIPVLAMLELSEAQLSNRATRLREAIGPAATVVRSAAKVGGGALPLLELEGPVVALRTEQDPVFLAHALRRRDPPLIARIHDGRVILDPRTLADAEVPLAAAAVRSVIPQ